MTRTCVNRPSIRLLAAFGTAIALAACGSAHDQFQSHMERGKRYLAADNLDKASVEFRGALQIEPKNSEAFYYNGEVAERRGNLREAVDAYQGALDAHPDDIRARSSLAKVLILAGAIQQANQVISPGLLDHPDDPGLLAARAAERHQVKDDLAARADAERAVHLAPTNEDAVGVLAALALRAGDGERAATLVAEAIAKAPDSVGLRRIMASVYFLTEQPRKAEEQMRKIIALEPREIAPRMELAAHFVQARELDSAQQVLAEAVRDLPQTNTAKLALVDFITTQRSRAQGEKTLRDFVAREPDDEDLRLALGMLVQRSGATQEASDIYREIVRREGTRSKGLAARDRLAALAVAGGHDEEARKLIAEVLEWSPRDDDALIMRANLELAHGDPANAIVDLRAVLHDQPNSVVLQRSLARAYLAKGEPALAEEVLRSALDAGLDDTTVRIDLAQILLQTDRTARAVGLLEEAVHKDPKDTQARTALIQAYLADHDLSKARTAAEDFKIQHADSADAYYLAGLVAHSQGQAGDSERNLERALQLRPGSLDILGALTQFSLESGHGDAAIARLRNALEGDPKSVGILNLLGSAYLERKDLPRATDAFTRSVALAPRAWAAYRGLGRIRLAAGDTAGAIDQYKRAFRLAPTQLGVTAELAALYEKQGRIDAAISCYEALYKGKAESRRFAANNLAMLLVTYKTDQASLERAEALIGSFDTTMDPSFLDTAGWVRFKRHKYSEAVVILERAADRAPDSKVIHYHLGMAQLQLGQKADARTNLETALSGSATFTGSEEARSALASLKPARTG